MSEKTGAGLAVYAKVQLGHPYWWGTYGQIATAKLLAGKRKQYPEQYRATNFEEQFGQRVYDCVGLIKGYLWSDSPEGVPHYNAAQDVAVSGLYRVCDRKGEIGTIPELPGVCVFLKNLGHVGVYVGEGRVIEAKGHAYGVVESELRKGSWAMWGMPKWISYGEASGTEASPPQQSEPTKKGDYAVELPLLRRGSVGEAVRGAQMLLIGRGYYCGPGGTDGEFGGDTQAAVRRFQTACSLEVDGIIGPKTMRALLCG